MVNPAAAFTPAQVIDDPERFAGRQRELDEIADALAVPGGHIVIYGNRGIGKSSLAQQMILMSQSNVLVTDRLTHKPFESFDFLPVYVQCEDSISSIDDVLIRLLTTEAGLANLIPFRVTKVEGSSSLGGSLSLKLFKAEAKGGNKVIEERTEITPDVRAVFINALNSVLDVSRSGVLIVIDEFDRIKDRSGLASLLKSLDARIKVALVGVSTNVTELIGEHESIARQLTQGCVKVDPMNARDVEDLFDRAENVLQNTVSFPSATRAYIEGLAKGHPFLVHVLGLTSTISALRAGKTSVKVSDAEQALQEIAIKGTAPIQESMYKKAAAHSYTREVVLKTFAEVADEEIRTTPVYAKIAERLGLKDQNTISVYMGHLTSDRYGAVLEKTRERYYRFKDSLFKAYAASRPFLLPPTASESDE